MKTKRFVARLRTASPRLQRLKSEHDPPVFVKPCHCDNCPLVPLLVIDGLSVGTSLACYVNIWFYIVCL